MNQAAVEQMDLAVQPAPPTNLSLYLHVHHTHPLARQALSDSMLSSKSEDQSSQAPSHKFLKFFCPQQAKRSLSILSRLHEFQTLVMLWIFKQIQHPA